MIENLTSLQQIILFIILIMNIFTYFLFYIDKKRAIQRKQRISEKTLLGFSFLLGGLGAFFGMAQFRHKTKHFSFKYGVPVATLITLVIVYLLFTGKVL